MTSSVADSLVGRVIDGRYRILSHLADGGMASVYAAMDARLDREVAIKIMRPGLAADSVFVERFRSEARAAARLSHPNVVAVYDQGEDSGDVFLAMELVEGKTLREVIHEEAPLTARESLAILEPILLALRAAHAAGIIHRDVKPENVIVRRDGEVKVADFGLARAINNQTSTSATGVLLGTVSYLSPEQVERGTADPRSDVYAAGLLLFEMLTGRKAVTGDTPIQIAYKHVHGSIQAPSSVVSTVTTDLDELVARATTVEPDDRFASASDFIAALRAVRRAMTLSELDRRGKATVVLGAVTAPEPATAGPAPVSRTEPAPIGRPRAVLAASAGHPEGPYLQQTAALPVTPRSLQQHRRRRRPWWFAALLLLGGGVAAGWWFTAGPGGTTIVPGIVSQSLQTATASLETASLRADSSEAFSEKVTKGKVISVQPAPGSEVPKQSTVILVVSKGPERYVVPNLVGTRAASVAGLLGSLTLKLGDVKEDWSETVTKGLVISQDPRPGTAVRRGTLVAMAVSKGRKPISVPDVRGTSAEAATRKLADVGLKAVRGPDANSDTVPAGRVIAQSPARGTLLRGAPVKITVSKGPVVVPVPDLVGHNAADAETILTRLGFKVVKEYPFGGAFFDQVRVQSVRGGQSAPKGSTITLTIV